MTDIPGLHRWILLAVAALTTGAVHAADPTAPPTPDAIPRLPVTTGGIANSVIRGYDPDRTDEVFCLTDARECK